MTLHAHIHARLTTMLKPDASSVQLNDALRLLAKWRSVLIQNTVLQHGGTIVAQGAHSRAL